MSPIIFLDIDGVLSPDTLGPYRISPTAVEAFNNIVYETSCQVVLVSSWRDLIHGGHFSFHGFQLMLRSHGVTWFRLLGCTDQGSGPFHRDDRGALISKWRHDNGGEFHDYEYVVIDDFDAGIRDHGHPLVQPNPDIGLTQLDAEDAIRILTKSP
jgi:hypothetical protein